jgi:subtilisin family serine protease
MCGLVVCAAACAPVSKPPLLPPDTIPVLVERSIGRTAYSREGYESALHLPMAFQLRDGRGCGVIPLITTETAILDERRVVRGFIDKVVFKTTATPDDLDRLQKTPDVRVYRDVAIAMDFMRHERSAVGDASTVASKLHAPELWQAGMTGEDVLVGIVDTGFNVKELRRKISACRRGAPCFGFNRDLSDTTAVPGAVAGDAPLGSHGSVVAFDALIAAPRATLFDIVIGNAQAMIGDALCAFERLKVKLLELNVQDNPDQYPGIVLVNSWAVWNPPNDDPDNQYVENPNHLMASSIGALTDIGVDVVFMAGNCGPRDLPECGGHVTRAIYGANSYTRVISVAAATVDGDWLDYSSTGPGRIDPRKPDVTGYSEFRGFTTSDAGTSAAAPVVAGLVAAYRTTHPANDPSRMFLPDIFRDRLRRAIEPCDPSTTPVWSEKTGFGIVTGRCLLDPPSNER